MEGKEYRPRLTKWELAILRNLLDRDRYCDKRNVRIEEKRIKAGKPDSRIYPLVEQKRHLKKTERLLRKLNRLLDGRYALK